MCRRGTKSLKTRVGPKCSISRRGPDCTVKVYKLEESDEEVTVLQVGTQQGTAPRARAAQGFEFGEGKL